MEGAICTCVRLARRDTSLMLGDLGKPPQTVAPIESNAQFVEPGSLVFARDGALVGQPFDPATGRVSGEPFAIATIRSVFPVDGPRRFLGGARPAPLVYQSHSNVSHVAWVDRAGRELSSLGSSGRIFYRSHFRRNSDRRCVSRALQSNGAYDMWSLDLTRGSETRLTLDDRITEVAGCRARRTDHVLRTRAGRPAESHSPRSAHRSSEPLLPRNMHLREAEDVSRDGRLLGMRTHRGRVSQSLDDAARRIRTAVPCANHRPTKKTCALPRTGDTTVSTRTSRAVRGLRCRYRWRSEDHRVRQRRRNQGAMAGRRPRASTMSRPIAA